jgi:predicted NACHT family NTPase
MDFDHYLFNLIETFELSPLNNLYIDPDFLPENKHETINGFTFIEEWLLDPQRKHLSLLGDFGTGKTSFARKLAYNMAKALKKEPGKHRITFLVNLRECETPFNLRNFLHDQLKSNEVKPADAKTFLELLAGGHILLIFDAFDEIADVSSEADVLSNFKELNHAVKDNAKVILISRTHYFKDKDEVDRILKKQGTKRISDRAATVYQEISGKSAYEIVSLKEFSDRHVQEYLQKTIGDEWNTAFRKITTTFNLYDLCCHPILLDLIVRTLPYIGKESQQLNESELYEIYIQPWFDRKDDRLQIPTEVKVELLEEFAYKLWKEGIHCVHHSALFDFISDYFRGKRETLLDVESAVNEIRTTSFLVRDEYGNYSFSHGSFHEFFVARKIKREFERSMNKFDAIDLRLLSKGVVFFLRNLIKDTKIKEISELLKEERYDRIYDNAFFICYTNLKKTFLVLQRRL